MKICVAKYEGDMNFAGQRRFWKSEGFTRTLGRRVSMSLVLLTVISYVFVIGADLTSAESVIDMKLQEKMSLQIDQLPLNKAINMIATRYGLNMVVSDGGDYTVSLNLHDVTIKDALDAILTPNGFAYTIAGNVIVVSAAKTQNGGGLTALTYRLKFISPEGAKKAITPLLSSVGKVEILGAEMTAGVQPPIRPSMILVRDYPTIIDQVEQTLSEIDLADRMIMIEVRMIESKVDTRDILGFAWPTSVGVSLQDDKAGSSSSSSTTEAVKRAGYIDLPNGSFNWGTLNLSELSATLDFLSSNGNSKLVSHPKLATRENNEAEFKVTTIIPVQTINRFNEGPSTADIVSFQDIEVGISLKVTPRINNDSVITMDVYPIVEEITGFVGTANQQKPITSSRSVRTSVTCKNTETVVIGGLLKESDITIKDKVFLLGDIPAIGQLFTHSHKEKQNTDLVVMITPTILR